MNSIAPLLAAGIDMDTVIRFAVLFIIVVVPVIVQVLAKIKSLQQPPGGPQRPPPPDAADEINEFMQRAAEKRAEKQAQKQAEKRPQPIRRRQTPQPAEKPVQAEVVAETPVGGQIGKQVEKYLDTQEFSQRTTQLGGEVAQADKEIDQHLQQVFGHRVSKLETLPGETATPPVAFEPQELTEESLLEIPATFATGLSTLLADADSIRQAIVLNEIFHRPEERWGA